MFQSRANELMQISIKKSKENSRAWTIIYFQPNPTFIPGENLNYLPKIDSYCIAEEVIYNTTCSPFAKKEVKEYMIQLYH